MTDAEYFIITDILFRGSEDWVNEKKAYFCDITFSELSDVLDNFNIDVHEKASIYYGPTFYDYLFFMANNPEFTCHGYVSVVDGKADIHVEGVYGACIEDKKKIDDFEVFAMTSDTLRVTDTYCYCRWN